MVVNDQQSIYSNSSSHIGGGPLSPGSIRTLDKIPHRELIEEQRQAMLENFDMEVEDKARAMRTQLDVDKKDLVLKADCDIAQLPKCVREMPLKTFVYEYGGDVTAAVRGALKIDDKGSQSLVELPETPLVIRARRKKAAATVTAKPQAM